MEKITVVKIGGNVIDDPAVLKRFIADFAAMPGPKILVHGGGKVATRLAERLELKVQMVDGRRITDKGTLDVVTMVYAGLVNKQLVASLQAEGCNALGMSGADGNAVTARRRAPQPIDYGFVGDIEKVDSRLLGRLLEAGVTPVFCAIMHDGQGTLLNCNADSVHSWIGDPRYSFAAIIIVASWATVGYLMIIYMAALQGVPKDLLESAELAGANSRQCFFRVTLPLILPAVTICVFWTLNSGFQVFDVIYALTGGGPGRATQSVAMNIYEEAFRGNIRYGYATAKSTILFVIVLIITLIQLRVMKSREAEL